MKPMVILCLAATMAFVSGLSHAEQSESRELASCKRELRDYFGNDAVMDLVSARQFVDGAKLKVAVRQEAPDSGNWKISFATCWVAWEDLHAVEDSSGDEVLLVDAN